MSETFDNIRDALALVVEHIIPKGNGYIVEVRSPQAVEEGYACTVQVVARGMCLQDGDPSLTLHLPFDLMSGAVDSLRRFEAMPEFGEFEVYLFRGIECYVRSFGPDVDAAEQMIRRVLEEVYDCPPWESLECEVHMEGSLQAAGRWRAPPGGITVADDEE